MDLPSLLRTIGMILLVVLVFNLMIVVHELGHFWAARWRGLKVDRFQIWFGRAIWQKTVNGVEWGMGWIPFGGYVKLPQMAPMEAIEGGGTKRESLPEIRPLDKIIVAFAGPLASFLLAVLFAVLVMIIGRPPTVLGDSRIGGVMPGSPAERAGILAGDRIVEIDGEPVEFFAGPMRSIQDKVTLSPTNTLPVVVERPGAGRVALTVHLDVPAKRWWQRSEPRMMGVAQFYGPDLADVMPNSPAALAGLGPGDRIESIDGQPVVAGAQVEMLLRDEQPHRLGVMNREGARREVTLAARKPERPEGFPEPRSGLGWASPPVSTELVHPGVGEQIAVAGSQIWRTLRALTSKQSGLGVNDLAGPVGIGRTYYTLLDLDWRLVLWFSVMLNVNLAILNLLPLPVLDGGHITLALVEGITRRRVPLRLLEPVYMACALLLFGFMGYKLLQESWLMGTRTDALDAPAATAEPEFLPPTTTLGASTAYSGPAESSAAAGSGGNP